MAGGMKILVLNGGSSSFKCWFADLPDDRLLASALQPQKCYQLVRALGVPSV